MFSPILINQTNEKLANEFRHLTQTTNGQMVATLKLTTIEIRKLLKYQDKGSKNGRSLEPPKLKIDNGSNGANKPPKQWKILNHQSYGEGSFFSL